MPAKADVFQGTPLTVGMDPEAEDSLVRTSELPGSRYHPATVHPDGKPKGFPVLQGQALRGQFGCAIERDGRGS